MNAKKQSYWLTRDAAFAAAQKEADAFGEPRYVKYYLADRQERWYVSSQPEHWESWVRAAKVEPRAWRETF